MWHTSLFKRSSEAPFSFLHSGTIVGSWAPPFPSWMRAGKRWVSKELVELFAAGHAHTGALFQVQSRTREDISSGFWWWLWKLEVTPSRASTVPLPAVHPRPSELTVPGQVYLILEQELMGSGAISNKKCTLSPEWLSGSEAELICSGAQHRAGSSRHSALTGKFNFQNHKSRLWIRTWVLSLTSDRCSSSHPAPCHGSLICPEAGQIGSAWGPTASIPEWPVPVNVPRLRVPRAWRRRTEPCVSQGRELG